MLKRSVQTIDRYCKNHGFLSLATLLTLCDLSGEKFGIKQIEPHIIAYKGGHAAKPIRRPKIPLVETPNLFAFMGHMAGDGGHTKRRAYYGNTQETLVHKVCKFIQEIFGEVPISIRKRVASKKLFFNVRFGMASVRLLGHLYGVDFRTHTARVPQRLFTLPREYAAAYLQAFGDDEGCVLDGMLVLSSSNKLLAQDLYVLVEAKFPELREFVWFQEHGGKKGKPPMYNVHFRTGAYELYRALIGFTHPEKQQELDYILTRRQRGWVTRPPETTRRMLLHLLSSGPRTAKELARKVDVTDVVVRQRHMGGKKGLLAVGFVRVQEERGLQGVKLFEITARGRQFLHFPSLGLLSGHAGRTRAQILKTLMDGSLTTQQLQQHLGLTKAAIRQKLTGFRDHGKWKQGLFELNLITRSGKGVTGAPYVYRLTDKGHRVAEALTTQFPALLADTKGPR